MTAQILTQARLQELLHYAPETGLFTWSAPSGPRVKKGARAGSATREGYLTIRIDKKLHKAHRLAWLYVYGLHPKNQIDHINQSKSDNRICNLRSVSNKQNLENRGAQKNNTSGYKGVSFSRGLWQAQICSNGKRTNLGRFYTAYDAHLKYEDAAKKLFTHYEDLTP